MNKEARFVVHQKALKIKFQKDMEEKRYKADFIKFLTYATASCDELKGQLKMLVILYPDIKEFQKYMEPYIKLSIKINNYIQYVEKNWRT